MHVTQTICFRSKRCKYKAHNVFITGAEATLWRGVLLTKRCRLPRRGFPPVTTLEEAQRANYYGEILAAGNARTVINNGYFLGSESRDHPDKFWQRCVYQNLQNYLETELKRSGIDY